MRREDETIKDDDQGEEVDKRAMAWHDELPKTEIKLRPKCCIPGSWCLCYRSARSKWKIEFRGSKTRQIESH